MDGPAERAEGGRRSRGPGLLGSWREIRPYMGASSFDIALLVGLSAFAGFAEAGVLLLVVRAALAVTQGDGAVDLVAGPIAIDQVPIATLLVLSGVALVLVVVSRFWSSHLIATVSARSLEESRAALFRAFMGASWDVQAGERAGTLQEVIVMNSDRVATASLNVATGLAAGFQFTALLLSGVAVQPAAALVILLSVIVLFFVFRPISRRSRGASTATVGAKGDYARDIAESVAMAQEVRTFDVGAQVTEDIERDASRVAALYRRSKFLNKLLPSLYQNSVLLVILLGVLIIHLLDIDDVAALGAVVLMLVRALTYSQTVQTTHQAMADLLPYLDEARAERERYEASAVRRDGRAMGSIERLSFEGVGFSYDGTHPALADIDLEIGRGEAVGVVGPSGSGKSTFLQLLLRLRQPQQGRILVDGTPADELAIGDWYAKVALVPQEARLFSGTVRENVRFHRPWITDEDIERAVELAHVADDIERFPDGWDTHVGERGGGSVSGGQRQRLCLARALAGRPDVLVLDEPTSALDMRSEALIRETLEALKGDVTLVIVAHRMSTLTVCDRLVVLDRGRIAASGAAADMVRDDRFLAEASELSRR